MDTWRQAPQLMKRSRQVLIALQVEKETLVLNRARVHMRREEIGRRLHTCRAEIAPAGQLMQSRRLAVPLTAPNSPVNQRREWTAVIQRDRRALILRHFSRLAEFDNHVCAPCALSVLVAMALLSHGYVALRISPCQQVMECEVKHLGLSGTDIRL